MDLDLTGKRALVTGSTRGIGLASATGLAQMGAEVIVSGREQAAVSDAIAKIKKSSPSAKLHAAVFDLGGAEGCAGLIAQFGEVDILVNNVGIYEPKAFFDIEDADWTRMFEVNVMSGVRLTLPEADAREQGLGARPVRLQRVRHLRAQGDGTLRLFESRPALHRARRRRADQVHQHHRQLGFARSDLGRDGAGAPGRARQGNGNDGR